MKLRRRLDRRWRPPLVRAMTRRTVLTALGIAIGFATACSSHRDPQSTYDHAWAAFQHGDLPRADQEASAGYDHFRSLGPEWAWKFAILRARVLYERGLNDEALKLLSSQTQPVPPGELAVQKLRVE